MTHVPYRGGGPAINDLIPRRVDVMFAGRTLSTDSGAIRALAVTSAMRSPFLPDIPSIAESGVPGFDVCPWYALFTCRPRPRLRSSERYTSMLSLRLPIRKRSSDLRTLARLPEARHQPS